MRYTRAVRATILTLGFIAALVAARSHDLGGSERRFFDDDPLGVEPETQDASGVEAWDIDLVTDVLVNLFTTPGDPRMNVRAQNVNTIDEVPDSSWFVNRIRHRPITLEELRRGANTIAGPAAGQWTIIRPKTSGFAPGFTVRDVNGEVWFLTFDPVRAPGAATAAIAVASRLFWALGYNQVESYLASVRPEDLAIAEGVMIEPRTGHRRPFTANDVRAVLARAARSPDGSYRVLAGRAVPGRVVGGFRYHGTRPDDPNDLVPHEHRRELRALKVFGAWTNLVDLKAGNTLDTVVSDNGRHVVRHYLQDVGSTFGTGAEGPREWDEGWEPLYRGEVVWRRLVTLGFHKEPWQRARYRELPEIGRFEGDVFDPEQWRSRVPAAAVLRARDDDAFWAALRVMAFTDEMIRAAAAVGEFRDPDAEQLLADVLIKRRDKIGQTYLARVNPVVRPALDAAGTLTFANAAVEAGVATPPRTYRAAWSTFDNATGDTTPLTETSSATPRMQPGVALPSADGAFVQIDIAADHDQHQAWSQPVQTWFRRAGTEWRWVGLTRLP